MFPIVKSDLGKRGNSADRVLNKCFYIRGICDMQGREKLQEKLWVKFRVLFSELYVKPLCKLSTNLTDIQKIAQGRFFQGQETDTACSIFF